MAGFRVIIILIATGSSLALADDKYGRDTEKPGKSCRDIYLMNPASHDKSGYYIIMTNKPTFVYCDMTLECGGEKGWMRIADVNPAKGGCPNGWKKITDPVAACRPPNDHAGCFSAHFPTHNIPYSRVCGMVIGIQKGSPDGFVPGYNQLSIDLPYLDGVSITYGTPRKHIWSYAAGLSDDKIDSRYPSSSCPCSQYLGRLPLPFVYDHYYCESGAIGGLQLGTYFTRDPLWDGKGCGSKNTCCTQPNLPWFFRQLPLTNNEDIEARICYNQPFADESVLVKEAQLYVQ